MPTATLTEFLRNTSAVEKAAKRGPVQITRRGQVISTFTASKRPTKGWPEKPDFAGRAIKTHSRSINMLEYLDR